ncbi:MAG: NAD-binding protein, partial [Myxococcales bacterium]
LEAVGIARAHTLATVLPSDALNVFITLTARNLNPELQILARGEQPSAEPKLIQAGADRVVLPTAIGADEIAQLILHPGVGDLFDEGAKAQLGMALRGLGTRVHVARVPSGLDHAPTVGELEEQGGGGFVIVAVRTTAGEVTHAPGHGHRLAGGDELAILGRSDRMPDLETVLASMTSRRELTYRGARVSRAARG